MVNHEDKHGDAKAQLGALGLGGLGDPKEGLANNGGMGGEITGYGGTELTKYGGRRRRKGTRRRGTKRRGTRRHKGGTSDEEDVSVGGADDDTNVGSSGGRRRRHHHQKSRKGKSSKWIQHVKQFAKANRMKFPQALKDKRCRATYKKM